MKQNIKHIIILALLLMGNITVWSETKTITYSIVRRQSLQTATYTLEGNNGESYTFKGTDLENPLVIPFQDVTLTATSSDNCCHIGVLQNYDTGFYGHGYAFKFESTNYYITHVTVKGKEGLNSKTAETNNNSKSCTVNWPYDNVIIKEFTVTLVDKLDISPVTVTGIDDTYDYTGNAITPSPNVTYIAGSPTPVSLTKGTDYTVTYVNNTEVGTATIILTGIGEYTGTWSRNFTINKADATVTGLTLTNADWNGTAQPLCSGAIVTGGTLKFSTDGGTTWSEDVPTATAIGSYEIYYCVDADQNHNSIAATLAGTAVINVATINYGCLAVTANSATDFSLFIGESDGTATGDITIPTDIVVNTITMSRTFTPGKSATIMLPFDIDIAKISGGTFYGFIGIDKLGASGWEVVMSQVGGTLQAHTPYLFIPTAETMTFNLGGETVTLKANSEQTYTVQP